jgi:hypothetical protein
MVSLSLLDGRGDQHVAPVRAKQYGFTGQNLTNANRGSRRRQAQATNWKPNGSYEHLRGTVYSRDCDRVAPPAPQTVSPSEVLAHFHRRAHLVARVHNRDIPAARRGRNRAAVRPRILPQPRRRASANSRGPLGAAYPARAAGANRPVPQTRAVGVPLPPRKGVVGQRVTEVARLRSAPPPRPGG